MDKFRLFFFDEFLQKDSDSVTLLIFLVLPRSSQLILKPGICLEEVRLLWELFWAPLIPRFPSSSSLLGCATHLTWMAGVVEMFSEVNTTWVEEFKVVMVGTLQME